MSFVLNHHNRLRALAAAVRFAWIPIGCAVVVAIASRHPNGRALALALVLPALCLGVAVHARELFYRAVPREPDAPPRWP